MEPVAALRVHRAGVTVAERLAARAIEAHEVARTVRVVHAAAACSLVGDARAGRLVAVIAVGAVRVRAAGGAPPAGGRTGAVDAGEILAAVRGLQATVAAAQIRRALAGRLVTMEARQAVRFGCAAVAPAALRLACAGDAGQPVAALEIEQAAVVEAAVGSARAARRVAVVAVRAVAVDRAAIAAAARGRARPSHAHESVRAAAVVEAGTARSRVRLADSRERVAIETVSAVGIHDTAVTAASDGRASSSDACEILGALRVLRAAASVADVRHADSAAGVEAAVQPVCAVAVVRAGIAAASRRHTRAGRVAHEVRGAVVVERAATAGPLVRGARARGLVAVIAIGAVGVDGAAVPAAARLGADACHADQLPRALRVAEAVRAPPDLGGALACRGVAEEVRSAVAVHGAAIAPAAHRRAAAGDTGGAVDAVSVVRAAATLGHVRHAGAGRVAVEPVGAVAVVGAAIAAAAHRRAGGVDADEPFATVRVDPAATAAAHVRDAGPGGLVAVEPIATVTVGRAAVAAATGLRAAAIDADQLSTLGVVGAAIAGPTVRRARPRVAVEAHAAVDVEHTAVTAAAHRYAGAGVAGEILGAVGGVHAAAAWTGVGVARPRRDVAVEARRAVRIDDAAVAAAARRSARARITDQVGAALGVRRAAVARSDVGSTRAGRTVAVVAVGAVAVDGAAIAVAAGRDAGAADTRQIAAAVGVLDATVPAPDIRRTCSGGLVAVEALAAVALDDTAIAAAAGLHAGAREVAHEGACAVAVLDAPGAARRVGRARPGGLVTVEAIGAVALDDTSVAAAARVAADALGPADQIACTVRVVRTSATGRCVRDARAGGLVAVVAVSAVRVDDAPIAAAPRLGADGRDAHQIAGAVRVLQAVVSGRQVGDAGAAADEGVTVQAGRAVGVRRAAVAATRGGVAGPADTRERLEAVRVLDAVGSAPDVGHAGSRRFVAVQPVGAVGVRGAAVARAARGDTRRSVADQPLAAVPVDRAAVTGASVGHAEPGRLVTVERGGAVCVGGAGVAPAACRDAGARVADQPGLAVGVGHTAPTGRHVRHTGARRGIAVETVAALPVHQAAVAVAAGLRAGARVADEVIRTVRVVGAAVACRQVRCARSGGLVAVVAVGAVGVGCAAFAATPGRLARAVDAGQILAAVRRLGAAGPVGLVRGTLSGDLVAVVGRLAVAVRRASIAGPTGGLAQAADAGQTVPAVEIERAAVTVSGVGDAGASRRVTVQAVGAVVRHRAAVAVGTRRTTGAVDADEAVAAVGVLDTGVGVADVRGTDSSCLVAVEAVGTVGVDDTGAAGATRHRAQPADAHVEWATVAVGQAPLAERQVRLTQLGELVAVQSRETVGVDDAAATRPAVRHAATQQADLPVAAVGVLDAADAGQIGVQPVDQAVAVVVEAVTRHLGGLEVVAVAEEGDLAALTPLAADAGGRRRERARAHAFLVRALGQHQLGVGGVDDDVAVVVDAVADLGRARRDRGVQQSAVRHVGIVITVAVGVAEVEHAVAVEVGGVRAAGRTQDELHHELEVHVVDGRVAVQVRVPLVNGTLAVVVVVPCVAADRGIGSQRHRAVDAGRHAHLEAGVEGQAARLIGQTVAVAGARVGLQRDDAGPLLGQQDLALQVRDGHVAVLIQIGGWRRRHRCRVRHGRGCEQQRESKPHHRVMAHGGGAQRGSRVGHLEVSPVRVRTLVAGGHGHTGVP